MARDLPGAEQDMKRVDCIGMVGRLETPKGLLMFWDTGKAITPIQFAEILALQHSVFSATGKAQQDAVDKIFKLTTEIIHQVNVWPVGQGALADDGRILVTEPWYEEKEGTLK